MSQYNYPGQPTPYQTPQFQVAGSYFTPTPAPAAPVLPTGPPEKQRPAPAVSAQTASQTLRRLIALELRDARFSATPGDVMLKLEWEVETFVQQLYQHAHDYANLSDRSCPSIADLAMSCHDIGLTPSKLKATSVKHARKSKKRRRRGIQSAPQLITPDSRHSSPELLGSDDEDSTATQQSVIPVTLRYQLQPHFPPLPPKHTYLRTPTVPPKKAALPSLEKKLNTANLVQKSLQNLLTTTEDSEDNKDADLLGHTVNWQSGSFPRKRWKL